MPSYAAPLDDIRFVLHDLLAADQLSRLPGYEAATPDVMDAVIAEAARFCEKELHPLNLPGDAEGCSFENGVVRTPAGFARAYQRYVEGGWPGLSCATDYGGQGLPQLLNFVTIELMCSANLSFSTYPGLSHGAYDALAAHGSEELRRLYLPRLADGTWSGTMCLTEPQCGTDLGLIRARATPAGDGTYRLSGSKIFISAGEHDLTENIVHLVLARLPDAPPGIKGISMFLVPKFLPVEADGGPRPGPRNAVACGSIEHKMGIRASATCTMSFEEATAWLVGEPHKGLRAMFVMMNAARLAVGLQGLGVAEVSYQNARDYARTRLQGRSPAGPAAPELPADPILVHPDVRRHLLGMKAWCEGGRALAYWVALDIDRQARHPDPVVRQEAGDRVALLTPVVKALLTDQGFEAANAGVQVLGGHGYIHEWGLEQLVRDARIAQIYEGANGIQALDLVGRKLGQGYGRLLRRVFHPIDAFLAEHAGDADLAPLAEPLAKAFGRLQQVTAHLAQLGLKDPEAAAVAASDYLRAFGIVVVGYLWARMAVVARARLAERRGPEGFHRAKLATARFYMARILPETASLFLAIMAGKQPLMELEADGF